MQAMAKCNMACLLVNTLSSCNNDWHSYYPKTKPVSINACLTCKEADKWLKYCELSMVMPEYTIFILYRM